MIDKRMDASPTTEGRLTRAFLDSPALFAISTLHDGKYIEVNDTFLKTLGLKREEVIGRTSTELDLWHDTGDREKLVSQLKAHGSFVNQEVAIRKKNGESFIGLFSGSILQVSDSHIIFTFATDITEKRRLEYRIAQEKTLLKQTVKEQQQLIFEEKKEKERALEDLDAARQLLIEKNRHSMTAQVVSSIIHQWRQPLNNLGLLVQQLHFEKENYGADFQTYLERATELILYMGETAETFRSFLRTETQVKKFDVAEAIKETIFLHQTMYGDEGIQLDFSAQSRRITADGKSNEFSQALLNVINNARYALLQRKRTMPKISVDLTADEGKASVTISDNGGGISETCMAEIFKPYYTSKTQEEGTGIGLFITKTIIEERMRGKVAVSNNGHGARFTFTFPCHSDWGSASA